MYVTPLASFDAHMELGSQSTG